MLGFPLEKDHLNVFSPQQEWSLQGDFILDTVRLHEMVGVPGVFWSPDLTTQRAPFDSPQHLNLVLHSPNAVDWTITIPENTRQVTLNMAITISQSAHDHVEGRKSRTGQHFWFWLYPMAMNRKPYLVNT